MGEDLRLRRFIRGCEGRAVSSINERDTGQVRDQTSHGIVGRQVVLREGEIGRANHGVDGGVVRWTWTQVTDDTVNDVDEDFRNQAELVGEDVEFDEAEREYAVGGWGVFDFESAVYIGNLYPLVLIPFIQPLRAILGEPGGKDAERFFLGAIKGV